MSYNGALDSLGQSQVLPYLAEIRKDGHEVRLFSFEKRSESAASGVATLQEKLREQGIYWTWLWYHKRPPVFSTIWDLIRGIYTTFWLTVRHRIQVLHARSHVAAAMAWPVARFLRRRFIFELRGQMAYEYADGGTWTDGGFLYRLVERAERRFARDADVIVLLTHRLANDLKPSTERHLVVIPTCVDLELFAAPSTLVYERRTCMAYSGSLGARYAPELLVASYLEAAQAIPGLELLILTHSDQVLIARVLADASVSSKRYTIAQALHHEVPRYLSRALFGVLLLRGDRSLRGACPTKVGEYLAAGLPVLSSPGIGDCTDLLEGNRGGHVNRCANRSQAATSQARSWTRTPLTYSAPW